MRLLALLPLALVACGGDDERPLRWSYIRPAILVPNCATAQCHSSLAKAKDMDFTKQDGEVCATVRSLNLVAALRGGDATVIPAMPPDQPLPEADIALIERWTSEPFPQACE